MKYGAPTIIMFYCFLALEIAVVLMYWMYAKYCQKQKLGQESDASFISNQPDDILLGSSSDDRRASVTSSRYGRGSIAERRPSLTPDQMKREIQNHKVAPPINDSPEIPTDRSQSRLSANKRKSA